MTNGKGDGARPKSVTEQEYAERWARTFRTTSEEKGMSIAEAHGEVNPTYPMYSYLSRREFTLADATTLRDYVLLFQSTHHGPEDERDRKVLDIADRIEAMAWR